MSEAPSGTSADPASASERNATKRSVLLKLELSKDVQKNLGAVASHLYGIDYNPQQKAENNQQWRTTDEVLYGEARKSYDEIIKTFQSEPRVYKFEILKDKIWQRNKTGGHLEEPLAIEEPEEDEFAARKRRDYMRRQEEKARKAKGPLSLDEQANTYIDPFATTMATKAATSASQVGSQKAERVPVWSQKLQMLEKLTPRGDLEGYEYKEDYFEQQYRNQAQEDFQARMRGEIARREEAPTQIEQVEDVLFDVVEAIARNAERVERTARKETQRLQRVVWHPCTSGFKMKALGANQSESGQVTRHVSDADFVDCVISAPGNVLAVSAPREVFELHAEERRIALEEEVRQQREEEFERTRPLTQKLRIAVAMSRHDPGAAAKKAAADVLQRATEWPRRVSQQLLQNSIKALAHGASGLLELAADPEAGVEALSASIVSSYRALLKGTHEKRKKGLKFELKFEELEEIMDAEERRTDNRRALIIAIREAQSRPQDRTAVPVKHEDTVQMTLTLLMSPPPAYTMRPPHSWRREAQRRKRLAMREIEARAARARVAFERLGQQDVVVGVIEGGRVLMGRVRGREVRRGGGVQSEG
ncbi:hypothetical protein B484DRAFT_422072, partial [Ochromonadaceae sp. CCMP2298]